jgi:hypothetical protein
VKSAHNQVVESSFGFKGCGHHFEIVAGAIRPRIGGNTMRPGPYISALEHGAPFTVKAASVAVSAVLFLIVALPVLAIGAAVVS